MVLLGLHHVSLASIDFIANSCCEASIAPRPVSRLQTARSAARQQRGESSEKKKEPTIVASKCDNSRGKIAGGAMSIIKYEAQFLTRRSQHSSSYVVACSCCHHDQEHLAQLPSLLSTIRRVALLPVEQRVLQWPEVDAALKKRSNCTIDDAMFRTIAPMPALLQTEPAATGPAASPHTGCPAGQVHGTAPTTTKRPSLPGKKSAVKVQHDLRASPSPARAQGATEPILCDSEDEVAPATSVQVKQKKRRILRRSQSESGDDDDAVMQPNDRKVASKAPAPAPARPAPAPARARNRAHSPPPPPPLSPPSLGQSRRKSFYGPLSTSPPAQVLTPSASPPVHTMAVAVEDSDGDSDILCTSILPANSNAPPPRKSLYPAVCELSPPPAPASPPVPPRRERNSAGPSGPGPEHADRSRRAARPMEVKCPFCEVECLPSAIDEHLLLCHPEGPTARLCVRLIT